MSVEHATVSLTQTAARISHAFTTEDNRPGHSISFNNETGVAVRVGGAGVTTSTGRLVAAGAEFSMDLDASEELFAVCASGTHDLFVMRSGV